MTRTILLAALAATLPAAAAPHAQLSAQTVPARSEAIEGVLVDPRTGEPVAGALVVLLRRSSERVAAALTGPDGRFRVAAPGPGRYRLRAERVGFASTTTPEIEVGAGKTVTYRMSTVSTGVTLEGVTAEAGGRRCQVRPEDGGRTQVLWQEARKALEGAVWAEREGVFTFRVRRWNRGTDPTTGAVTSQEERTERLVGRSAFRSAPAAELRERGYIGMEGTEWVAFAPDAAVLLSDEFLDDHCFRVVDRAGDEPWVGLAFQPVRDRRRTDVAGTLWVDRASAELREMEFRYTGLEGEADDQRAGGRVEFERLPGGAWIVRRWSIRLPHVEENRFRVGGAEQTTRRILAFHEEGAEVAEILSARGVSLLDAATLGTVEGTVSDAATGAPVPGARVFVAGTSREAEADTTGRFRVDGLDPGTYTVSFSHPRLDSLGYNALPQQVVVERGTAVAVALLLPTPETGRAALCEGAPGTVVHGRVTGGASAAPLAGARVQARWNPTAPADSGSATALSNERGQYLLCGVPAGTRVSLAVSGAGDRSDAREVVVPSEGQSEVALEILSGVERQARRLAATVERSEGTPARNRGRGAVGRVVTREQIVRMTWANSAADLLRGMNGIISLGICHGFRSPSNTVRLETVVVGGSEVQLSPGCRPMKVFLNDAPALDGMQMIAQMPVEQVERLEVLSPSEAGARYGTDTQNGVLLVYTRATGSSAAR